MVDMTRGPRDPFDQRCIYKAVYLKYLKIQMNVDNNPQKYKHNDNHTNDLKLSDIFNETLGERENK